MIRISISNQLLLGMVAISLLIVGLLVGVRTVLTYSHERAVQEEYFSENLKVELSALSESIWVLDLEKTQAIAEQMVTHGEIDYLVVEAIQGSKTISFGQMPQRYTEHRFALEFHGMQLGKLTFFSNRDHILNKTLQKIEGIVIHSFFLIFGVGAVLFLVVHLLVTRHLVDVSSYLQQVNLKAPTPMRIRRPDFVAWREDELASLVGNINSLVSKSYMTQDVLEKQVRLRTAELEKARDEADTSNRIKSQFLANMSHEIRTPMNGIMGITSLMLSEAENHQAAENLAVVQSCCESLLTIIDDILDFSKIEAGRSQVNEAPFDLWDCVAGMEKLFGARAQQKGVSIKASVGEQVPQWVLGDQTKIRQVLANLVGNAVKFTSQGEILMGVTSWNQEGSEGFYHFTVADSGIGMTAEALDLLFQPFSQVDSSNTRQFGGTGLGLAISKGLVEAMGGRIWVESQLGVGTTFSLVLPLPSTKKPHVQPEVGWDHDLAKEVPLRILVAEDNSINQRVISGFLGKLGYTVDIANNGQEALEAARKVAYDVIFMDCHMPVMDGFQATQLILAEIDPVPYIIALTASTTDENRRRCFDAGMAGFVSKPITRDKLAGEIRKVVA